MRWLSSILALTLFGATIAQAAPPGDKPRADPPAPALTAMAGETDANRWPLSLPEAIRIALDNSEIVRLVSYSTPPGTAIEADPHGSPIVAHRPDAEAMASRLLIARVVADTPAWKFRADAMALVRSVEQQYWVVAAQRVRVACAEQVVKTAADIIKKEQADLLVGSRGAVSDLAEAAQSLELFENDRKLQATRLADADRRLRILLGLPPADGRRIVTTTRATDQPVTSDPRASGSPVDAGYHRYQQARQHRIDAARRLDTKRTYYDQGRITIDRYFDAIRQHAEAVAAEADRAAEYNTSIAALDEAKGTLLADRSILVLDRPLRIPGDRLDGPAKSETAVKKASFEAP